MKDELDDLIQCMPEPTRRMISAAITYGYAEANGEELIAAIKAYNAELTHNP